MKNANIAKVLKEQRKRNNFSVEDVAIKLEAKNINVATKTIYGWESGQAQPDADTLLILCEIYHISDILGSFGYQPNTSIQLTQFEKQLIINYRQQPKMQEAVKRLLGLK